MLAPASTDEATVRAGREALQRLRASKDYDDWIVVGKALAVGREHAKRAAGVTRPFGKPYVMAFSTWTKTNHFAEIHKSVRGVLLKIIDNLAEIDAWRNRLSEDLRLRLNHPDSIWRHFAQRDSDDTPPPHAVTIWPAAFRQRARQAARHALEIYGADSTRLADAALDAALPCWADVKKLLAAQVAKPRGRPSLETRPQTPAVTVLGSHA
jgi:hypothetical protein